MSFQVADPIEELAIAVVHHSMLDAHAGDKTATEWLVSDLAIDWLDLVNLDGGFIQTWIKNGCQLENTLAIPRFRSFRKDDDEYA